jgi:hypothetical protein
VPRKQTSYVSADVTATIHAHDRALSHAHTHERQRDTCQHQTAIEAVSGVTFAAPQHPSGCIAAIFDRQTVEPPIIATETE